MAERQVHPWWRETKPEKEWKVYEDFRYFLWVIWRHLNLPDPTPVQYDIALYLQHGPRREIIEAFRGVGKSWITSAYVCWLLLRDPQQKIMVVSASKDRADQFSIFTKMLIAEVPILQHLKAKKGQRDSNIAFDVGPSRPDHSPSVKSVGIFGQLTGSRADVIIADDVEVPNNSETQTMRDKLAGRVKEFDAVLKPGGRVIYLGTPQTEESLYNILPERGYQVRVWPARMPTLDALRKTYGDTLAPIFANALRLGKVTPGEPTDPMRFDELDLQEREASYGRSGFALQFMLDTRLSDQDRYPLRLSDLVVTTIDAEGVPERLIWSSDPETVLQQMPCVGLAGDRYHRPAAKLGDYVKPTGSVMFIDPAGRGKDETAYAVVKQRAGYLYLVATGGLQDGYGDGTMMHLANVAKEHKVNTILVEPNFGDGMFAKLFQPWLTKVDYKCSIEDAKRSQMMKEKRICDTLEPVMNQHRLVVDPRVIEADYASTKDLPQEQAPKYQLFYQMSRITRDKGALAHDDRLDALAGAVAYWLESMSQDDRKAAEERAEELRRLEHEHFKGRLGASLQQLAFGMDADQIKLANAKMPGTGAWLSRSTGRPGSRGFGRTSLH